MIPELKGLSYTDRLKHLKLFSMDYRRKRGDMIQFFKILNGFENIDAQAMFTFATSQTRGHNKNYISKDVQRDLDKVSKGAKIRNRYNQVPHLTQDTNGKVTNSQKTPQTRAKRSALSPQVTTKHI